MIDAPKKNLKDSNTFELSTEMIASHKAYTAQSNTLTYVVCWYLACYKKHISTDLFFDAVNKLYFDILSLEKIKYRHPTDTLYVLSYFIRLVQAQSDRLQQIGQAEREREIYKIILVSINLTEKFLIDDSAYLIEIFNCRDPNFAKFSFAEIRNLELNALKELQWNLKLNGDEKTHASILRKLIELCDLGHEHSSKIEEDQHKLSSINSRKHFEQILHDAHEAIGTLVTLNPFLKPTTDQVEESLKKQSAPILAPFQQLNETQLNETQKNESTMKPKF